QGERPLASGGVDSNEIEFRRAEQFRSRGVRQETRTTEEKLRGVAFDCFALSSLLALGEDHGSDQAIRLRRTMHDVRGDLDLAGRGVRIPGDGPMIAVQVAG